MDFKEILYDKKKGVARITINRPEKYNACTPVTIYELTSALTDAWVDKAGHLGRKAGKGVYDYS